MHCKKLLLLFFLLSFITSTAFAQQEKLRVEPSFWWTDMKNPDLQLMLHGQNISHLQPELKHPGVKVKAVTKVKNPNYLFVTLNIENAKPGKSDLKLKRDGKTVERYTYELRKRDPKSATRQGFDTSDVLYLITPDRFANGNPDRKSVV